jgi:hypothetical protein
MRKVDEEKIHGRSKGCSKVLYSLYRRWQALTEHCCNAGSMSLYRRSQALTEHCCNAGSMKGLPL